jgi:hypothetical protein
VDWGELVSTEASGRKWSDLRYIFLFIIKYRLLNIWRQLGKSDGIEDYLSDLDKYSFLLDQEICKCFLSDYKCESVDDSILDSSVELSACYLEDYLKMKAGAA